VSSVIIGASTEAQLRENLAAAAVLMTEDEIMQLDAVSALPAEYPEWLEPYAAGQRTPKNWQPR
jgi:diketogulonate reductase-like aldo/keto reductase